MKLRIKARFKANRDTDSKWGWYGTDLTWTLYEFPNHETSIQITTDDGDFVKFHGLNEFLKMITELVRLADQKYMELNIEDNLADIRDNVRFQTVVETQKVKSQDADEWGWFARDLKLEIISPEPDKTNEAAIRITDPEGQGITFNGLSAFLEGVNKVEDFAQQHGLILDVGDVEIPSFSDKDKDVLKNLGIKARRI